MRCRAGISLENLAAVCLFLLSILAHKRLLSCLYSASFMKEQTKQSASSSVTIVWGEQSVFRRFSFPCIAFSVRLGSLVCYVTRVRSMYLNPINLDTA